MKKYRFQAVCERLHRYKIGGASLNCIKISVPMNPCPCGCYPDRNKCRCTPYEIHNYLSHISGPILDRIDLCVMTHKVEISELQSGAGGMNSGEMKARVLEARNLQKERYQGTKLRFNSDLGPADMEKYCFLESREKEMLEKLCRTMDFSARIYHRLLKVARTIADLDGASRIGREHLAQAVCFRPGDLFDR